MGARAKYDRGVASVTSRDTLMISHEDSLRGSVTMITNRTLSGFSRKRIFDAEQCLLRCTMVQFVPSRLNSITQSASSRISWSLLISTSRRDPREAVLMLAPVPPSESAFSTDTAPCLRLVPSGMRSVMWNSHFSWQDLPRILLHCPNQLLTL